MVNTEVSSVALLPHRTLDKAIVFFHFRFSFKSDNFLVLSWLFLTVTLQKANGVLRSAQSFKHSLPSSGAPALPGLS